MLSFGKIVLLVVVVLVAVIGFRLVGVIGKSVQAREPAPRPRREKPRRQGPQGPRSADLTACPACGAYSDGPCDRPDCGLAR